MPLRLPRSPIDLRSTLDTVIADLKQLGVSTPTDRLRLERSVNALSALRADMGGRRRANRAQSNPALVVFGNPSHRAGEVISHNVQAVLYLRDDDSVPYIHGFGEADLDERALERGDWNKVIGQLHDSTGVEAVLQKDGSILLRGPLT